MRKMLVIIVLSLAAALILAQWIPTGRRNPPVTLDIPTAPEVKAVLKQSCYDCHSNETIWPWYSSVAPISWFVVRDVNEGREELNFSTWDQYSAKERVEKRHESWEEVEEGEMPPWFYTAVHRDAKLSPDDRVILRAWAADALRYERGQDHQGPAEAKETGSQ